MSKPIVPYLPPQHPTLSKDQTQKKKRPGESLPETDSVSTCP